MLKEPTNRDLQRDIQDLKEVINVFATGMHQQFATMNERFAAVDRCLETMDQRFDVIEGRTGRMEANMVTKAYLDVRLGTLVDILADHRVIAPSEAKRVLS